MAHIIGTLGLYHMDGMLQVVSTAINLVVLIVIFCGGVVVGLFLDVASAAGRALGKVWKRRKQLMEDRRVIECELNGRVA